MLASSAIVRRCRQQDQVNAAACMHVIHLMVLMNCYSICTSMRASTCTVKLSPSLSTVCRPRRISPIRDQRCPVRVCSLCQQHNSSCGIFHVYRLRQWVHSRIRLNRLLLGLNRLLRLQRLLSSWLRVGLEQLLLEDSPFRRAGTLVLWMHSHCSCTPSAGPSESIRV